MTRQAPFTPITIDIFRQLPEGPPYYELIEGKLIMSPSPNFYHQKIAGRLFFHIEGYLQDHPIGDVTISPSDVCLDVKNAYQPDLYFISKERLSIIQKQGPEGAPDLVVEVLSESTLDRDRTEKLAVYARAGVQEMWIVDPVAHSIEVRALAQGIDAMPCIIREPDPFSPAMFPGLRIDTIKLFKPVSSFISPASGE